MPSRSDLAPENIDLDVRIIHPEAVFIYSQGCLLRSGSGLLSLDGFLN